METLRAYLDRLQAVVVTQQTRLPSQASLTLAHVSHLVDSLGPLVKELEDAALAVKSRLGNSDRKGHQGLGKVKWFLEKDNILAMKDKARQKREEVTAAITLLQVDQRYIT